MFVVFRRHVIDMVVVGSFILQIFNDVIKISNQELVSISLIDVRVLGEVPFYQQGTDNELIDKPQGEGNNS